MTQLQIEHQGRRWRIVAERAIDLSIPIDFEGAQPSCFGAPRASAEPLRVEQFVGDVIAGGSCNCPVLTLIPHCNGTHTECVGHIVEEAFQVTNLAPVMPISCRVATVTPKRLASVRDFVPDPTDATDFVIDTQVLEPLLDSGKLDGCEALVLRTLPNAPDKRVRDWSATSAPYFTSAAMAELAACHIDHLIVDLPSLDRADDGGRLAAHRAWWGLPANSRCLADASRAHCTVTELAYVPDQVADGFYFLSLQIAPMAADAAPSRPVLLPVES